MEKFIDTHENDFAKAKIDPPTYKMSSEDDTLVVSVDIASFAKYILLHKTCPDVMIGFWKSCPTKTIRIAFHGDQSIVLQFDPNIFAPPRDFQTTLDFRQVTNAHVRLDFRHPFSISPKILTNHSNPLKLYI